MDAERGGPWGELPGSQTVTGALGPAGPRGDPDAGQQPVQLPV